MTDATKTRWLAWLPLALQIIALVGVLSVACYRVGELENKVDAQAATFARKDVVEVQLQRIDSTLTRIEHRLDRLAP